MLNFEFWMGRIAKGLRPKHTELPGTVTVNYKRLTVDPKNIPLAMGERPLRI